ncbi:MAG: 4Fe-4S dicluster domain-containing protein [Nitrospirota bacterium]
MKELFIAIERCTACKSCEIACAMEHSPFKNLSEAIALSSPKRMVHVEKARSYAYPVMCMHCTHAKCIASCPTGAMRRDSETYAVFVDEGSCNGCKVCTMVCPFGAVTFDMRKRAVVKCDRCRSRSKEGKAPACAEACPTGAITFGEPDEFSKTKRQITAEHIADAVGGASVETLNSNPLDILRKTGGR